MKQVILEIAQEIIRDDGAAALNLNEIARRLGMKTPSLYTYFSNKLAIYDALFHKGSLLFAEAMRSVDHRTIRSWEDYPRVLEANLRFALEHPELWQLLFERPVPKFNPSTESIAPMLAVLDETTETFRTIARSGEIHIGIIPPEQIRDLFLSLMHGITALHLANDPHLPIGEGRFGSLIPVAVEFLRRAWGRPDESVPP